jgi:hypothetical protein
MNSSVFLAGFKNGVFFFSDLRLARWFTLLIPFQATALFQCRIPLIHPLLLFPFSYTSQYLWAITDMGLGAGKDQMSVRYIDKIHAFQHQLHLSSILIDFLIAYMIRENFIF